MSYVVGIWEQPASLPFPGEINSATRLMDLLYRVAPGKNPKFQQLADRLMERYPDFDAIEANGDDGSGCVWTDGSLSGEADSAVWNVGIVSEWLDDVLPVLIQEATELGLNVFDGQAAQVNFADGTLITKYERRLVAEELAIFDALVPLLAEQGWEVDRDKRAFSCGLENSTHRLDLTMYEYWPPRYCFALTLRSDQEIIGRERYRIEGEEWKPGSASTIAYQDRWLSSFDAHPLLGEERTFVLGGMKDLGRVVPFVEACLVTDLFPLVKRYDTIEGFDSLINPSVLSKSMFFQTGLVNDFERGYRNVLAAQLAGNPRVLAICDEIEAALATMRPASTAYFFTEQAVAYVRQCIAGSKC